MNIVIAMRIMPIIMNNGELGKNDATSSTTGVLKSMSPAKPCKKKFNNKIKFINIIM